MMRNNSNSLHRRLKAPGASGPSGGEGSETLSHGASLKQLESRNLSKGLYLSSEVYNQEAYASGSKKKDNFSSNNYRPPSTTHKMRPISRPNLPPATSATKPMSRGRPVSGTRNYPKFVSNISRTAMSPRDNGMTASPRRL